MAQVVFDFPPSVFSALRKAPAEFATEMRLAAAIHWFSQGLISQGKAAEIAGVSRAELLDELSRRKMPSHPGDAGGASRRSLRVTRRRWVVNASPLIFLAQIDAFPLLKTARGRDSRSVLCPR